MPLLEAAPAASAGGVLGHEEWMVAHRSLAAIVRWLCRREPLFDEVSSMIEDDVESLAGKVLSFSRSQVKPAPKTRPGQALEDSVQIIHRRIRSRGRLVVRESMQNRWNRIQSLSVDTEVEYALEKPLPQIWNMRVLRPRVLRKKILGIHEAKFALLG